MARVGKRAVLVKGLGLIDELGAGVTTDYAGTAVKRRTRVRGAPPRRR